MTEFSNFGPLTLFRPTIGSNFIVIAIDRDMQGDAAVTIMFAGRHGTAVEHGGIRWDGLDYSDLESGLIDARCRAHCA